MNDKISHRAQVPPELAHLRLDQVAAKLFQDYSRSRLQEWIQSGELRVNGAKRRPRDKLAAGDELVLEAVVSHEQPWHAEPLPIDPVYQDKHVLVLNKPAGLVVHPAAGNWQGTLLNGLLHAFPELENLPRAGIVHRLDKDTTGLMVVARSLKAHTSLVAQLQARSVSREYEAVASGRLTAGGTVDAPLGRHPVNRKKRAVLDSEFGGQEAVTHYRILNRFRAHTHLKLNLETGRTHQIRVHMAHIGFPLVGDPLYAGRLRMPAEASQTLREALRQFRRQALHARRLGFCHPDTEREVNFEAPCPADMQALLDVLQAEETGDG